MEKESWLSGGEKARKRVVSLFQKSKLNQYKNVIHFTFKWTILKCSLVLNKPPWKDISEYSGHKGAVMES